MNQQPVEFPVTLGAEKEIRTILMHCDARIGIVAPHQIVMRSRIRMREEIACCAKRRSLLIRALSPAVACVGTLYTMMVFGKGITGGLRLFLCLMSYILAMFIPWLVVREAHRGDSFSID